MKESGHGEYKTLQFQGCRLSKKRKGRLSHEENYALPVITVGQWRSGRICEQIVTILILFGAETASKAGGKAIC